MFSNETTTSDLSSYCKTDALWLSAVKRVSFQYGI